MKKCLYPGCDKPVIPPRTKYCSEEHGIKYQGLIKRDYTPDLKRFRPEKKLMRCLKCNRMFYTDRNHRICDKHRREDVFDRRRCSSELDARTWESRIDLEEID